MDEISVNKIKAEILEILDSRLPNYLTYHNTQHTLYVLKMAEVIGKAERISESELKLLQIACLFHDIGFAITNNNHEAKSCIMAARMLPRYHLDGNNINIICGMIMATKIPQMPTTKLERIIADADLEYLGTKRYNNISLRLFNEWAYSNKNLDEKEWLCIQIDFMENHQYFTDYCLLNKQPIKLANLNKLKENYNNLLD